MAAESSRLRVLGLPTRRPVDVADDSDSERKVLVVGFVGSLRMADPASTFPFAKEEKLLGTKQLAKHESGEDWRGTQRRHQANRKYRR